MDRPIRVLQVAASIGTQEGGPALVALELARSLRRRGHDAKILTTDSDGAGRLDLAATIRERAADLDVDGYRVHSPMRLKTSFGLWRALRREVPTRDIVHIHQLYYFSSWAAAREARRARVPYVIHLHGSLDPYHRTDSRAVKWVWHNIVARNDLRCAAGFVVADQSEADGVAVVVGTRRSHVMPYGGSVGSAEGQDPVVDQRFLLYMGRIATKKRIDVLIDAFTEVAPAWDGLLVLAGTGDRMLIDQLRRQAAASGVGDRIRFVGHVEGARKNWLLHNARATLLSSENENFANSVAESLSVGVPVVLTPHVALARVVNEYRAGIVADLDARKFALAILEVAGDEEARAGYAAGAMAAAAAELSWSRTAQLAEQVFRQAMSQRG